MNDNFWRGFVEWVAAYKCGTETRNRLLNAAQSVSTQQDARVALMTAALFDDDDIGQTLAWYVTAIGVDPPPDTGREAKAALERLAKRLDDKAAEAETQVAVLSGLQSSLNMHAAVTAHAFADAAKMTRAAAEEL